MKLKVILISLLLSGCALQNSSSIDRISLIENSSCVLSSKISSSNVESSLVEESSFEDSSSSEKDISYSSSSSSSTLSNNNSSSSEKTSTQTPSSSFNVCEDKPGGKNEDGSDKLPIPCNKDNKIKIGKFINMCELTIYT